MFTSKKQLCSGIVGIMFYSLLGQQMYAADNLFLPKELTQSGYTVENFDDDVEEIAWSDIQYRPELLKNLQDHVYRGAITPYMYDQGRKALQPFISPTDTHQIKKSFERKVKSFPVFTDNNFKRDLQLSFEALVDDPSSDSFRAFEELLAYYRALDNPAEYRRTLTVFARHVVQNNTQAFTRTQWEAFTSLVSQSLSQLDPKICKKIEREQRAIQKNFSELPFDGGPIPKGFNSSLAPQKVAEPTEQESVSITEGLKGLAHAAYTGARYALRHPGKTLALGLLFSPGLPAVAAQAGPEFTINNPLSATRDPHCATKLANGNAALAWASDQGGTFDIWARLFNGSDGSPLGNEFMVNTNVTGDQRNPDCLGLSNGNWWVSYTDDEFYEAVILSPTGTTLVSDFQLSLNASTFSPSRSRSSLAEASNGNVLALFPIDPGTFQYDVHGRYFDPAGLPSSDEVLINQNVTGNQIDPKASPNGQNMMVVYASDLAQTFDYQVRGRLLGLDALPQGDEFPVSEATTGNDRGLAIKLLPTGDQAVFWSGVLTSQLDILRRFYFPNATARDGSEVLVNQVTFSGQSEPSVCLFPNSMFVPWVGAQATEGQAFGIDLDFDGTPRGNEIQISQTGDADLQKATACVPLDGEKALVSWTKSDVDDNIMGSIVDLAPALPSSSTQAPSTSLAGSSVISQTSDIASESATVTSGSFSSSEQVSSEGSTAQPSTGVASSEQFSSEVIPTGSSLSDVLSSAPFTSQAGTLDSSDSQTRVSPGASNQTVYIIGGTVGVVVVGGIIVAVVCLKCRSSKKSDDKDVEMGDTTSSPTDEHPSHPRLEAASAPSEFFDETYQGYSEHPHFRGKITGHKYEKWDAISREEAEQLMPRTAKPLPKIPATGWAQFELGKGAFGRAYAGYCEDTQKIVAIKEITNENAIASSRREGEIVHLLGEHPHIMPIIDFINYAGKNNPRLLQVMPLAYINGEGFKALFQSSTSEQKETIVSDFLYQLMMGLTYIHEQGYIHRDIKDENLLIMDDGTVRIADFGRAKKVGRFDTIDSLESLGDIRKLSPEIIAFFRHCLPQAQEGDKVETFSGKLADVWAAGLCLWEILEDNPDRLFSLEKQPSIMPLIQEYTYSYFDSALENIQTLEGKFSPALLGLLRMILTVRPEQRKECLPQIMEMVSSLGVSFEVRAALFENLKEKKDQVDKRATAVFQPIDSDVYLDYPQTKHIFGQKRADKDFSVYQYTEQLSDSPQGYGAPPMVPGAPHQNDEQPGHNYDTHPVEKPLNSPPTGYIDPFGAVPQRGQGGVPEGYVDPEYFGPMDNGHNKT